MQTTIVPLAISFFSRYLSFNYLDSARSFSTTPSLSFVLSFFLLLSFLFLFLLLKSSLFYFFHDYFFNFPSFPILSAPVLLFVSLCSLFFLFPQIISRWFAPLIGSLSIKQLKLFLSFVPWPKKEGDS
jgi:hypothetical protein